MDRVPSAKLVTVATLVGHDLRFHKASKDGSGKCDAYFTNSTDDEVIGVVYEIDISDKTSLDRKEGLGFGYDEKEVTLTTNSGELIIAITYYATSIDPSLTPYDWYTHHVITGATENNLPKDYVDSINEVEFIEDPDRMRYEREMAIYQ